MGLLGSPKIEVGRGGRLRSKVAELQIIGSVAHSCGRPAHVHRALTELSAVDRPISSPLSSCLPGSE